MTSSFRKIKALEDPLLLNAKKVAKGSTLSEADIDTDYMSAYDTIA